MGKFFTSGAFASKSGGTSLDSRLVDTLKAAAALSPYNVEAFSGVQSRSAGTVNHPTGHAVDVFLVDPKSGERLTNYSGAAYKGQGTWQGNFPAYEQFAQTAKVVQQQKYPDMPLRWGGYFPPGKGNVVPDLMHFDDTPQYGGNMGWGTWDKGLMRNPYKLASNGGLSSNEDLVRQVQQQYASLTAPRPPMAIPEVGSAYADSAPIPLPDPRTPALDAINSASPSIPTPQPSLANWFANSPNGVKAQQPLSVADLYSGMSLNPPTVGDAASSIRSQLSQVASLDPSIGMPSQQPSIYDNLPNGGIYSPSPIVPQSIVGTPAPPVPMDRLRVAPPDILSMAHTLTKGSKVNLEAVSPDQQLALLQALPKLMNMPSGQDGEVQGLKYLEDNNLLGSVNKVVPTQSIDPFTRAMGNMKYGVPIPDTAPTDPSIWNLSAQATQLLPYVSDPQTQRRPIMASDGITGTGNGTVDPVSSPSAWAQPYLDSMAPSIPTPKYSLTPDVTKVADAAPQQFKTVMVPNPAYVAPSTISATGSATGGIGQGGYASGSISLSKPSVPTPKASVPQYITKQVPVQTYTTPPMANPLAPNPAAPANPLLPMFNSSPAGHIINFLRGMASDGSTGLPARQTVSGPSGVGQYLNSLFSGSPSGSQSTPASITAQLTPQVIANQNPLALAALQQGQSSYTAPGGGLVPTVTINGTVRNSYGDAANGIGKSLSSIN